MSRLLIVLLSTCILGSIAHASEFGTTGNAVQLKNSSGVVSNIDLAQRTIIIGAVRYLLPSATAAEPLRVFMLGKDYGSLELLQRGMAVKVRYYQSGRSRAAIEIVQVHRGADT